MSDPAHPPTPPGDAGLLSKTLPPCHHPLHNKSATEHNTPLNNASHLTTRFIALSSVFQNALSVSAIGKFNG